MEYSEKKYDPTNKFQAKLNTKVNKNKLYVEKETRNAVLESNSSVPTLKGLIKFHKLNKPMRSLINFIGDAPTHK